MRLDRRLLAALALCSALLVGACTDAGELGGPAIGGTAAAPRVGDLEIGADRLEFEADQWSSSPTFMSNISQGLLAEVGSPGRRDSDITAFTLEHRIFSEQARLVVLAAGGDEPSDDELGAVIAELTGSFPTYAEFATGWQLQVAEDIFYQRTLGELVEAGQINPDEIEFAPVAVNPRYGVAEETGAGTVAISPPPGPRAVLLGG